MKRFISFAELIDLSLGQVTSSKWGKVIGSDSTTEFATNNPVIFCFEDYFPLKYQWNYIQVNFKPETKILGSGLAAYHFYDAWAATTEEAYNTSYYKECYIASYSMEDVESIEVNDISILKGQLQTVCEVYWFEENSSVSPEAIYEKVELDSGQFNWNPDPHPRRELVAKIYNQILATL
jgi:hypothetical protein